jgi:MoaA/NifB/PqqE/SkfB family radical SAM enzyme
MSIRNYLNLLQGALRARLLNKPYKMNFAVTYRCNSKCLTCQIWKEYKIHPEMQKDELKFEEISKIFDNLSPNIRWLSLTGGEPFLRDDLPEIVNIAIERLYNLALISIPTNGLIGERILGFLDYLKTSVNNGPDISLSFSIDGPEEIHDKIRGIKGGFNSVWKTYLESKKLLNNINRFHLHIETTISPFNISRIKPFIESLKKEGHSVIITIAHDAYLYKNVRNESITLDPYDNHIIEFFSFLHGQFLWYRPSQLLNKAYIKRIPVYLRNKKKQVLPCAALESSFAINPYGDILPCLMWDKPLGNVRDCDFKINDIFQSSKTKDIRKQIIESHCPNCWTPCEAIQTIINNAPLSLIS